MDQTLQIAVTVICSVIASSGFWVFITSRYSNRDVKTRMLLGLAHDRIISLGMKYIERGDWITYDEYENLYEYLYKPYKKMGGNGSADRIMSEISKMRMVCSTYLSKTNK